MKAWRASLLLLFLGLAACATIPAPPPPPPDPKLAMSALETRIAIMIEEQREKLDPKAPSLAIDPELTEIARARATDMAAKNYLAHVAPNGDTSATLLMAQDAKFQGLLGENLAAQHYLKQSGVDVDVFAKRFVDTWLDSQPHRENFSSPDYNRTGVGAAVNGDTVYVTQLFAGDLGSDAPRSKTASATSYPSLAAAKAAPSTAPAPVRLRGAQGPAPGP